MAIFDTMRHIRPDVSTVCVGLAARYKFIDATVSTYYAIIFTSQCGTLESSSFATIAAFSIIYGLFIGLNFVT